MSLTYSTLLFFHFFFLLRTANDAEEGNTLFDTLRDTIYTEVASLISQNESRPHFLLELFRDIRQVDSDLMRQRTLYALQDLLKSGLKEVKSLRSVCHKHKSIADKFIAVYKLCNELNTSGMPLAYEKDQF